MSVAVKAACAVWDSAVTARNRIAVAFIMVAEILREKMMYINSKADRSGKSGRNKSVSHEM